MKKNKAGPDNWATVQNEEGIIYFGNSTGVLEYDGVSWRLIELPNQNIFRSLSIDIKNKIYVGGNNDIGFLAPDGAGLMQFNSLKDQLDQSVRDFQDVWFTHVHNGEVYYESFKYLMRWNGKKIRVWETDFRFRFSKVINDALYIMEEEVGLRKLVGDSLKTIIPITKLRGIQFYELAPFDDGQIVALSYDDGLFLINDNKLIPFSSPANAYLKKQFGYHLEKLPNGWYSVATLREGIVVIDNKGQIIRLLNNTHGLSDNAIYYQFTDREKWLWLATSLGISRVELLLPYTIFDDRLDVEGFVNNIYRHQGMLYVASNDGILQLEKEPRMNEYIFKHMENTFQGYDFLSIDHSLFAAANFGVYQIDNGEIINTFNYAGATSLHHSRAYADRLYIGYRGLASLKQVDGQWIDDGRINGITDDISEIAEDKEGKLWLESQVNGVWKVYFSVVEGNNNFHNPSVKHFRANKEISKGLVSLKVIRGEPIFEIDGEIYRYNKVMDSIIVDDTFGTPFGLNGKIMPLTEDQYGNVWINAQLDSGSKQKNRLVAMRADGDSYTIKKISNERISHDVSEVLYPEDDGIVWYGGADGIVRHDTRVNVNADRDFKPMIRKIMANGDSLIFGGAGATAQEVLLSHAFNNLRFEFAAPTFDDESANQFQLYLENFDNVWSAWTTETQKDYTNIPEGTYTFRLRTKNIYGTERSGASFEFKILPPIHRTWWAYSLYALFLVGFIAGVVKWRSRNLQKEKEALENIVAERTAEVSTQAPQLEKQAHELQELDRAKSHFFANISHEFRTPLTII